jgi:DNA polymerase-1
MKRGPTLLIDTDVLCHTFAYANTTKIDWEGDGNVTEFTNPEKAKLAVESFIDGLMEMLDGGSAVLALSDTQRNFRMELEPTYKAGRRKKKPRPALWYVIREFIEQGTLGFPVIQYPRLEGDDVLGILATGPYKGRSIIVTIDKDLHTIPGQLFLQHKPELGVRPISEIEAIRFHLTQTLTGDSTDEYPGLRGVGDDRAAPIIASGGDDPVAIWDAVRRAYEKRGKTEEDAIHQARLAYILRAGDYTNHTHKVKLWHPSRLSSA